MSHPYGTITGLDYSGKKKKIMIPENAILTDNFQPRTKYEKYLEQPATTAKPGESHSAKEKTKELSAAKKESPVTPIKLFTVFFVLACLMIVWIWETNYVREGLVEIEKLKDVKMELEKANESIQVDITRLSDYQRIEKIAADKLKMIPSKEKPGVIFLDAEKAKSLNETQKATIEP
ncbi:cell division protein FtsL [bacterium]|nr:cell division protein FtsL [bacterium]